MAAILELKEVSKQFPTHRAVESASFSIAAGEFFSLLGPSGCGKTTTLRLVAGFEAPTSGEIWLNGHRIDHLPPYERRVNTVFQSYALFPHLTVRGNIEFGLRQRREDGSQRRGGQPRTLAADIDMRVKRVLEQVRLEDKELRKPSELSGGERQRVALARSLVLTPDVLLLDEPLSALDPLLRKQVRGELKELQRSSGVAFLFVTHDQEEAMSLSDRIAVMHAGKVEQIGSPEEIYRRPRTRFVASFLGAMNWLNGYGCGVRPESLMISREPIATNENDARSQRGALLRSTFLGATKQIEVRLEIGETVIVAAPASETATAVRGAGQTNAEEVFQTGDTAYVSWRACDELRFSEAAASC